MVIERLPCPRYLTGAKVLHKLEDTFYGNKRYCVEDPEGHSRGVLGRNAAGNEALQRKPFCPANSAVRRICLGLPDTMEKLSHDEPTFFTKKGGFAMSSNNHHRNGHECVWVPAPAGLQQAY